jgi:hypothetical protein
MPGITLDPADAAELAEMLTFIAVADRAQPASARGVGEVVQASYGRWKWAG